MPQPCRAGPPKLALQRHCIKECVGGGVFPSCFSHQECLELAVELSSPVSAYDTDLEALKSNLIGNDILKPLCGVALLEETNEHVPREIVGPRMPPPP